MAQALLTLTHMDAGVVLFHANDERTFFEWFGAHPMRRWHERQFVGRLGRPPHARDPLDVAPDVEPVENRRYVESWKGAAPG